MDLYKDYLHLEVSDEELEARRREWKMYSYVPSEHRSMYSYVTSEHRSMYSYVL